MEKVEVPAYHSVATGPDTGKHTSESRRTLADCIKAGPSCPISTFFGQTHPAIGPLTEFCRELRGTVSGGVLECGIRFF